MAGSRSEGPVAPAAGREGRPRRGEARGLGDLWVSAGGRRIFARASPATTDPGGMPVVLVHGFGVSGSYFVPAAGRLAPEFPVYAPDLPGHGRSDTPAEAMDIPRLAEALLAWMDAAGLGRASLVAHSMGCQVAVDLAVRHPGRVDRLVLIGPTADPAGRTAAGYLVRLALGGPFERPSLLPLLLSDYARMGPRLLPEFRSLLADRIEDKLPRVAAPTLWVRGAHDVIAPRRWLDHAARLRGAGRIVEIPWWGHAVQYSGASRLVEAILPFLREARRGGG